MSENLQDDVMKLAPDRLVSGFGRTRIWWFLLLAMVLHVIAIGATSVDYIRDTWVDPEGAAVRHEAALKKAAEAEAAAEKHETAKTAATAPAPASEPASQAAKDEQQQILEEHKDAPVVQRLLKTAKPEEIPTKPDDLGITIDQTNPK